MLSGSVGRRRAAIRYTEKRKGCKELSLKKQMSLTLVNHSSEEAMPESTDKVSLLNGYYSLHLLQFFLFAI